MSGSILDSEDECSAKCLHHVHSKYIRLNSFDRMVTARRAGVSQVDASLATSIAKEDLIICMFWPAKVYQFGNGGLKLVVCLIFDLYCSVQS